MSTEITTAASAIPAASSASSGSLAAIGVATKAFVLAHPLTLTLAGGLLLGAGAYWGVQQLLKKDEAGEADAAPDTAASAA
jgi:hypothetical protein